MKYLALFFTVILVLSVGCASMQSDLTPGQRLFALVSEYEALQCVAADYCESPSANPEIKQAIKKVDASVTPVMLKMRLGYITALEAIPKVEEAIQKMTDLLSSATVAAAERRIA